MKLRTCVAFLLLVACESKPAAPLPAPAAGKLEHRMANCPNAVAGASTLVVNTADGVDVVVTASAADAQEQIRSLSKTQGQLGEPAWTEPENTGHHGGPGKTGYCPIIHDATVVTVTMLDNGASLHVKALDPEHVKRLQDATTNRVASMPEFAP